MDTKGSTQDHLIYRNTTAMASTLEVVSRRLNAATVSGRGKQRPEWNTDGAGTGALPWTLSRSRKVHKGMHVASQKKISAPSPPTTRASLPMHVPMSHATSRRPSSGAPGPSSGLVAAGYSPVLPAFRHRRPPGKSRRACNRGGRHRAGPVVALSVIRPAAAGRKRARN